MKPITIKSCEQRAADKKLTLIQAFFEIYQERLDQGQRPMSDVAYTQLSETLVVMDANASATQTLRSLSRLGDHIHDVLTELDAYHSLRDMEPEIWEGEKDQIKAEWVGEQWRRLLKVKTGSGRSFTFPEHLLPSLLPRPEIV